MSSMSTPKRRFRIERLEERIAPSKCGCFNPCGGGSKSGKSSKCKSKSKSKGSKCGKGSKGHGRGCGPRPHGC